MTAPAPAVPQRLWDGDRIAQPYGPMVWHRWRGTWINYLNAEGTGPFHDDQVRAGLAGLEREAFGAHPRGTRPSLRFMPRNRPTGQLPGSRLTTVAAATAAIRGLRATGAAPYAPGDLLLPRTMMAGPAPALASLSLAALHQLLVDALEDSNNAISFHRPAGRFYVRSFQNGGSETWTYVLTGTA
ncbi:hypothetical protein ACFXKF_36600 [Streptomyces scopuliridis]|uniref:hypothetical protein n=1 Tax=Streptomyces scopuliridis TaxID=452529 RepID=UPI0036919AA1